MKFLIISAFVALFAVAAFARPSGEVETVRQISDVQPDSYSFLVETSDGKSHVEDGKLRDVGTEHEALVVHGSFSWVAPDGHKYTVNYVADENGFQPEGAHLPVGPESVAPTARSSHSVHHK